MSHAGYRILELTEKIQENVAILKERSSLLQTDLPSLDDGISEALQLDPISSKARQAIADHTAELQMTVRGPESLIMAPPHNETASNLVMSTELPVFQFWSTHPDRAKRFADGMSWFAKTPAFNIQHLVDNHDFEKHGDGTLVDVGGSHGIAA
ncbi:MAG: hypothetical protein Q9157_005247 [Trypethelium eluteriae]